jgi:hypothetical protein
VRDLEEELTCVLLQSIHTEADVMGHAGLWESQAVAKEEGDDGQEEFTWQL